MNATHDNDERRRPAAWPRRRGVSLLEVMIALAIVIATAALVLPWTAGWLGDRELDQAEDQLAMQFLMARAAAREQGRPVEVVVEVGGEVDSLTRGAGSVEARWMSPAVVPGDDDAQEDGFLGFAGEDDIPSAIKASWARFDLPRGVSVALEAEDADGRDTEEGADGVGDMRARGGSVAKASASDGAKSMGSQTLAIFLPDGTAVFAPIFLLSTDAGAIRALQVDSVTGKTKPVAARGTEADALEGDDVFDRPEFEPPVDGVRGERGR
jgi:prepilin-type N-terminal cleavage/methylation domain-containing protein